MGRCCYPKDRLCPGLVVPAHGPFPALWAGKGPGAAACVWPAVDAQLLLLLLVLQQCAM